VLYPQAETDRPKATAATKLRPRDIETAMTTS
jgi:hypothetical protein